VVVETRKRRINRPEDENPVQPVTLKPRRRPAPEKAARSRPPAPAPKPAPAAPARGGVVLNELSASEVEARRRALQDSRVRDVEDRKRAEEEAARRAEEEARRAAEEAENAKARAEEEARLAKEAEARKQAEEELQRMHRWRLLHLLALLRRKMPPHVAAAGSPVTLHRHDPARLHAPAQRSRGRKPPSPAAPRARTIAAVAS
jgi:flagellar biosynthesis/type III secretory pathway protein FliH